MQIVFFAKKVQLNAKYIVMKTLYVDLSYNTVFQNPF